jgi:hypothetical protein
MKQDKLTEVRRLAGLGDVVSRVTAALGISECGSCARRKALLNKIVPFRVSAPPGQVPPTPMKK